LPAAHRAGEDLGSFEGGRLVFKTDIQSETPEVIYLEGVYVAPQWRGRGLGLNCLSLLGRTLLGRVRSVCLLVDEGNGGARSLYQKAGFKKRGGFDTLFLERARG
jgi:uncharacterized protein